MALRSRAAEQRCRPRESESSIAWPWVVDVHATSLRGQGAWELEMAMRLLTRNTSRYRVYPWPGDGMVCEWQLAVVPLG